MDRWIWIGKRKKEWIWANKRVNGPKADFKTGWMDGLMDAWKVSEWMFGWMADCLDDRINILGDNFR